MEINEIVTAGLTISEQDKRSALQMSAELDRRWNERDAAAFADLFETDGDFRFHTGEWVKGKASIEGYWRQVFPGLPEGMRHVVDLKRARFITQDVAIGDGTFRIVYDSEGQERVHLETEATAVIVKRGERWVFSAVRLAVMTPG